MVKIRYKRDIDYTDWLRGIKQPSRVSTRSWVRRPDGDWRVICLETGKIYLGPDSAALDLHLYYMDIANVCEKWLKQCGKNLHFLWYSDYLKTVNNPILPLVPEVIVVRRIVVDNQESQRKKLRNWRRGRKQYSSRAFFLSGLIVKAMEDNSLVIDKWIKVDDLNRILKDHQDEEWIIDNKGLSKHLSSYYLKYERLFNMKRKRVYNSQKSCWQLQVMFSYPGLEITREEVMKYDDEASYLITREVVTGYPVICLNNGRIFDSIEVAGRITGVPPRWVKWSCYQDIEYAKPRIIAESDQLVFRFIEYVHE